VAKAQFKIALLRHAAARTSLDALAKTP